MAEALVGLERDDGVAVLTLSAPPANACSYALLARVRKRARAYAAPGRAVKAVGLIKRAVQTGAELDALALERELQQQLFESEDASEGLAAHLEKRAPVFKGR